jgi:hypothetical protein
MPWALANGLLPGRGAPPGRGTPADHLGLNIDGQYITFRKLRSHQKRKKAGSSTNIGHYVRWF